MNAGKLQMYDTDGELVWSFEKGWLGSSPPPWPLTPEWGYTHEHGVDWCRDEATARLAVRTSSGYCHLVRRWVGPAELILETVETPQDQRPVICFHEWVRDTARDDVVAVVGARDPEEAHKLDPSHRAAPDHGVGVASVRHAVGRGSRHLRRPQVGGHASWRGRRTPVRLDLYQGGDAMSDDPMREALEDIRDRGLRADPTPSRVEMSDAMAEYQWWVDWMRGIDQSLRERARVALEAADRVEADAEDTVQRICARIAQHSEESPTHGVNCMCMDAEIRAFRALFSGYNGRSGDAQQRISYVADAAVRSLARWGCE